jgi:hypothetical protein
VAELHNRWNSLLANKLIGLSRNAAGGTQVARYPAGVQRCRVTWEPRKG